MLTKLTFSSIIILFLFGVLHAGIIEIPKDAETIQQGIDISSDYDTLLVEPGMYIENIVFSGKNIVIFAYGGPDVTTLKPADSTVPTVAIVNGESSDAKFTGFSVTGGYYEHVVFIDSGASPIIENNIFFENLTLEVASMTKSVIASWGDSCRPTICRNIFHDNMGLTTIWIQKGKGDIINNTLAYNNSAIMCNTGLAVVYNNIISYSLNIAVDGTYADFDYTNMFENNGDFG